MRPSKLERTMRSVEDARLLAQRRLPRFLYQRYEAGSGLGLTLRGNVRAFEEVSFDQRAGRFFSSRDLSTTAVGLPLSMPVMLAPVGALSVGRPDGEVAAARAARKAGIMAVLSTNSGTAVEEVAARAGGPPFYQLYFLGGRDGAEESIARAKAAGCQALVVTLDHSASGERERAVADRAFVPGSISFGPLLRAAPQFALRPSWLSEFARQRPGSGYGLTLAMAPAHSDGRRPSVLEIGRLLHRLTPSWDDLSWIQKSWDGPLVVKGITSVADARRAAEAEASAIVVSNHGGNGLDGRKPTLQVLRGIADEVRDDVEIWMDGGVRRGSDVVKAVALGAQVVLIGRAYVYALMAAGEAGVGRMLHLFRQDIDRTLAFLGCQSIRELDPSCVDVPTSWVS